MSFLLLRVSGVPLLERGLRKRRPGYADYAARTSAFFPLPPRRGARPLLRRQADSGELARLGEHRLAERREGHARRAPPSALARIVPTALT